ncbi:MAG TPA: mycothiol synthase [Dehalococcoidia bacterium]|nr:mycothiol synthase [Dehalococcoidia bacterium]
MSLQVRPKVEELYGRRMHHIEFVLKLGKEIQPAVVDLVQAAAEHDGHSPLGEHKFLRLSHGDDTSIGVLAWEEQRLMGYAQSVFFTDENGSRLACELVVHPEARGQGVGNLLLRHLFDVAERYGAQYMDAWAYMDTPSARALAAAYAFRPARVLLHLRRDIAGDVAEPCQLPSGLRLARFRPGIDDREWLALNARVFSHHPEQGRWTHVDLEARLREAWFDPDDFLVLRDAEGRMIAFNWLKVGRDAERDGAEIYVIGVAPEWAGRGIGTALITLGVQHVAEQGCRHVCVYTDAENGPALRLYDRMGFTGRHRDVCYRRLLEASPSPDSDGGRAAVG